MTHTFSDSLVKGNDFEGLPGLGGLEEVIVSLNSGEARISGGWGG